MHPSTLQGKQAHAWKSPCLPALEGAWGRGTGVERAMAEAGVAPFAPLVSALKVASRSEAERIKHGQNGATRTAACVSACASRQQQAGGWPQDGLLSIQIQKLPPELRTSVQARREVLGGPTMPSSSHRSALSFNGFHGRLGQTRRVYGRPAANAHARGAGQGRNNRGWEWGWVSMVVDRKSVV